MRLDPTLILRPAGPEIRTPVPGGISVLPEELLRSVGFRLRWAAVLYGAGFVGYYALLSLTAPGFRQTAHYGTETVVVAASGLLAAVVGFLAFRRRHDPTFLIHVGLAFEVFAALGISFVEFWGFLGDERTGYFGVSWVALWIMFFPLFVPAPPGRALLAGFLSALTGPLILVCSTASDASPHLHLEYWIRVCVPTLLAVGLGYFAASLVYRLGRQVTDARRLGAYELEALLGQGGMGEVWKAKHRYLSRPAAVKLIRPGALQADPGNGNQLDRRFAREAEATASLRSPHSVVLYDYGKETGGTYYYVMELLEGVDLRRLVQDHGPVPEARAARFLVQACHALRDAHARGLIHRDVKPANLYACRLGLEVDFVKVLDFGLVKRRSHGDESLDLTLDGGMLGTPAFMAPETILDPERIDHRADLYSLAAVGYWLVTGRSVFDGRTTGEVLDSHLRVPAEPPSRYAAGPVSAEFDAIILSCLAKRREDRPRDAAEVMRRMEPLADAWAPEDAAAWWDRHFPGSGNGDTTAWTGSAPLGARARGDGVGVGTGAAHLDDAHHHVGRDDEHEDESDQDPSLARDPRGVAHRSSR